MVTRRRAKKGSAMTGRRQPVGQAVAKLTSKGQITIPRDVRNDLGLRAGDELTFFRTKDGAYKIRRHVADNPFEKWHGYIKELKDVDIDELLEDWRGR